jgi:hypothetical protein
LAFFVLASILIVASCESKKNKKLKRRRRRKKFSNFLEISEFETAAKGDESRFFGFTGFNRLHRAF